MAQPELVPLSWPRQGIVENAALAEQPEGTTTDCLNVRAYDALDRRNRGGQRTGITTYIEDAVNGSNAIQAIGSVVLAFDSTTVVASTTALERDYNDTSISIGELDVVDPNTWDTYTGSNGAFTTRTEGTVNSLQVNAAGGGQSRSMQLNSSSSNSTGLAFYSGPSITLGSKYIFSFQAEQTTTAGQHAISWRIASDPTTNDHWTVRITPGGSTIVCALARLDSSVFSFVTPDTGSTSYTPSGTINDPYDYVLEVSGNTFTFKAEGSTIWTHTSSTYASQSGFAMGAYENSAIRGNILDFKVQLAETPASLRTTELVVVSGGNIYGGDKVSGLDLQGSGTGAVKSSGNVGVQDAFQKVYFFDGLKTGYRVLDPKTNTVTSWHDELTSGALPVGGTGSAFTITVIDTTLKQFTVADDLSSVTSVGDSIEVSGALKELVGDNNLDNNGSYVITAQSGSGPTVLTVGQSIPISTVNGTLALGDVGCTFGARYRGRLVMSGLETDPQNWFMSASLDPNNFNYFPDTTNQQQAVAGNNAEAGDIGDVVTALAPYSDDIMIMGGANSISRMNGDPAANGQIDTISDKVGISGPEAWTFDTGANFYFWWINGLYRMSLNDFNPVLLSKGKLDKTFNDIDISAKRIRLLYDPEWQGVHIFVTDDTQQTTADLHYFWDERNDSFWPDQYTPAIGPTAVHRFNADNPENNAVLLGGHDSFIRQFSDSVTDDDGTVISSFCRFTPITKADALAVQTLDDLTIITDLDSGTVDLKVFIGDTVEVAEAAADADTPIFAKELSAGRNTAIRQKTSQNAHIIELSQAGNDSVGATWAYEDGSALVTVRGKIHGRRV